MSKVCTKCGVEKPLSEFGKSKNTKDGKTVWCLQCKRDYAKQRRKTPAGIYDASKGQWSYRTRKPFTLDKTEFIEWYKNQPKVCAYCGLTWEETQLVDDPILNVSDRLTIDCKDNYKGYTLDNIVLACRRCNNIKNDFFTYEEMKKIAKEIVIPRWKKRLAKSKL